MKHRWTLAEEGFLADRYPHMATKYLAAALGLSERKVYQKALAMGLRKTAEYLASEEARRWDGIRGGETRFKPGLTPWNKGKPGTTGTQEACRATQFKAGRPPSDASNYKPIGSLRVTKDGYLEQKVSDDRTVAPARRWVALHRVVWERANGPVPEGCIVVFKAGMATTDPDLVALERVECITRAENMRRNTYHRYGPEVAKLVQLRGAITRQIRKRSKADHEQHQ